MVTRLKIVEGKATGESVALHAPRFLIGWSPECHLRPGDDDVAERHCELLIRDGHLALRDLGGSGGTMLNGHRIARQCAARLRSGDRIGVGGAVFELAVGEPARPEEGADDPIAAEAARLLQRRLGAARRPSETASDRFRTEFIEGIPVHRVRCPASKAGRRWNSGDGSSGSWRTARRRTGWSWTSVR